MPRLVWVLLSVIWGLTWLAVRIGLDDLPPITFAGIRFLTAATVLLVVVSSRKIPLPRARDDWLLMTKTGLLSIGLAYATQFWGQQFVTSGLTAVMFSTVPLFTILIAHVRLPAEPYTPTKLLGVLVGLGGVALIFSDQLRAETTMAVWGCLGFLVGAAAMALAQVTIKGRGQHLEPTVLAATQMVVGGTLLLTWGVLVEGNPLQLSWTRSAVASLLYLALIGSALAFFLFYWLLRHMAVTKVMTMALVHPLVAVIAGWLVLGESLGWKVLFGASGIMGGLALVLRGVPLRMPVPPAAPDGEG